VPNFLAMTATPIPRSLYLTLYGDLDVSELREMPPGRPRVETQVVPPYERDAAYAFVREQVHAGRQVFVICPIIEDSDKLGVRSATTEHELLSSRVFPDLRVELLHGRMPAREKESRMARFVAGDADILVSTSVVEVGVDVPNATVMVVLDADRFGVSHQHQLRGRVARGEHAGLCLLVTEAPSTSATGQRLTAVAATTDGFELARLDLETRREGDVLGAAQSGRRSGVRLLSLLDDEELIAEARVEATRLVEQGGGLADHPELAAAVAALSLDERAEYLEKA
jgi:ATP-dependent DNA helicase RecG